MSLQRGPNPDRHPLPARQAMTRLPLRRSTAGSSPAWWHPRRVLGGLLAASALLAQAAVTNGSSVDSAPASMGAGTRTLDKALSGDLSTGDRNLDLLLESQRKGLDRVDEAPAAQAMPARPAGGRQPVQTLPAAAAEGQAPRPPAAGQRFEPLLTLPERGQVGNAGPAAPKLARDWSGGARQSAHGPVNAADSIYGDSPVLRSAARPLRDWIQEGVALVKDNLITIALAGAVIALLAVGLKAYSRRI